MSAKNSLELAASSDEVCACCGIADVDDIKLKICDGGCDLRKYCSVECQENHRDQHDEECKKRKAELHDKQLFTQPDSSHMGECPICCLPLSTDAKKSSLMGCCCKIICKGCLHANLKREVLGGLEPRCAFCREPAPLSQEEYDKRIMKRIKKHNDPVAMTQMGKMHQQTGEYGKALEYYTQAAELGDVEAHGCLGDLYNNGYGVEKDEKRAVYHLEQAAMGGHPTGRSVLATHEIKNGRFERAAKHYIISANLGCDLSLKAIKYLFVEGEVCKGEYAAALRGYQAAINERKSAEREKGEAFFERHN